MSADALPSPIRELLCQKCGAEYEVWSAPNDIWNAAICSPSGDYDFHFLCPTCFIGIAVAKGCPAGWRVAPYEASTVTIIRTFA